MKSSKHKDNIRACFNRSAALYDQFAMAQQQIGSRLICKLSVYQQAVFNIMDVGCGSGLVTEKLATQIRHQQLYGIDFAEQLLLKAQSRLQDFNIQLLQMDFDDLADLNTHADIIFANMSLQWSLNLANTLTTLSNQLKHQGWLAFSLPLTETFYELVRHRHAFFAGDDIKQLLSEVGFQLVDREEEKILQTYASKLQALKAIKAMGAHYLFRKNPRAFIRDIRMKKKFSLTYHVGYFLARKMS